MNPTSVRKVMLLAAASIGIFQKNIGMVYAEQGIKSLINGAIGTVSRYAFEAKKIEYNSEKDFDPEGEMEKTIELKPGDSLKYSCGKTGASSMGAFMLVPANPKTHILSPRGNDPIDVASNRVQISYNVYRSNRDIVVSTFQKLGLDHLLIDYSEDTVLMARDPEQFSINLLCTYVPSDVKAMPKHRWLQIKFKNVLPMAFGCGSAGFNMFKNATPIPLLATYDQLIEATKCKVDAEPGMVVGIYCAKSDHVYPEDCFRQVEEKEKVTTISGLRDISFPYYNLTGNIRVMKIGSSIQQFDKSFTCLCKNEQNQTTAVLKVRVKKTETCDYTKTLKVYAQTRKWPRNVCYKTLEQGKTIRIIVAKSDGLVNRSLAVGGLLIYPENTTAYNYMPMDKVTRLKETKISHVIGSTGLSISKREEKNNYIYDFTISSDAVVVLKQPIANLTYVYEYYSMFNAVLNKYKTLISIGIVPTDPYTHGCGAGGPDIFNLQGVNVENVHIKKGLSYYTQVKCTLNGWKSSPVGFYCPKDHVLEPEGCFNSAFLASTNRAVRLDFYAPQARVLNSPNLRIVDFTKPMFMKSRIKYSSESLECRCRRKDGALMASITVDLRDPRQI
ncbi:uncharacterized protein BXIN_1692 [Babesia sp. Xinjiang]|uniref:uncharacterized protein n=1 Tax=Babesia sp. Xinjiang TaxID=462227 RepID=UPI000A21CF5E|nr:uncharacterized protein BXIN_1728 [Babesia sp. Xinjiang]XP_028871416.1 uncharacterized protein BXIN_1692 [Babesia sp. Xinjiang]ORM40863.1 hypothetical protein BXIN_1728 [Babesia sp. Xinjiang]ORM40960.1 hypothetical protein BXIN_1692 [Babesia sp. Xinjiang]